MLGNIIALIALAAFLGVEGFKVRDRVPRLILCTLSIIFAVSALTLPWTADKVPIVTQWLTEISGNPVSWLVLAIGIFFVARPYWTIPGPNEEAIELVQNTPANAYDDQPLREELGNLARRVTELEAVARSPEEAGKVERERRAAMEYIADVREFFAVNAKLLTVTDILERAERAWPLENRASEISAQSHNRADDHWDAFIREIDSIFDDAKQFEQYNVASGNSPAYDKNPLRPVEGEDQVQPDHKKQDFRRLVRRYRYVTPQLEDLRNRLKSHLDALDRRLASDARPSIGTLTVSRGTLDET